MSNIITCFQATTAQQSSRPNAGQTIMTVQQGQPRPHQPTMLQHPTPVGAPHPTSSPHNIQLVGTPQAVTTSASQMGKKMLLLLVILPLEHVELVIINY